MIFIDILPFLSIYVAISILHLALLMFPHGTTRTGFISFTVRGPLRSLAPLAAGHGCKGPGVATTSAERLNGWPNCSQLRQLFTEFT